MGVRALQRAGLALVGLLVLVTGCTSQKTTVSDHGAATPTTMMASSSSVSPAPLSTSRFSVITLRHLGSWRPYADPEGYGLPNGESVYLTNEPINPHCPVTWTATPPVVHCPDDDLDVDHVGPGGVVVDVDVYFQPPYAHPVHEDHDLDGYDTQITYGTGEDPDCASLTGGQRAVEVDATPPTSDIQPAEVVISACFGSHSAAAQHAFSLMLATAQIATRPAESVPVPGAPACTRTDLHLAPSRSNGLFSQYFVLIYQLTNISTRVCRIAGYPRVTLTTKDGEALPLHYRDDLHNDGPVQTLYLQPGQHANYEVGTSECQQPPYIHAATTTVTLPGTTQPITVAAALPTGDPGERPIYCNYPKTPWDVDISAITGV